MKHLTFTLAVTVPLLLLAAAPAAHAGPALGQISQLSGFAVATHATGTPKVLSLQSAVALGDTLATEPNTYAQLQLADGTRLTLGPSTQIRLAPGLVVLTKGQVEVTGLATSSTAVEAGGATIATAAARFTLMLVPDVQAQLAQRAYAQAALALASSTATDAPAPAAIWRPISQNAPGAGGGLAPGLYVHVIDGLIQLSNRGGVQQFAAGQFGFTGSVVQPPVIVPNNPGIQFNPPPAFSSSSGPASNTGSSKPKSVDCEVR